MISYFELMQLIKANRQPDRFLIEVDHEKERQLLFTYNARGKGYVVCPTTSTEAWYQEYNPHFESYFNEDNIFDKKIEALYPNTFKKGEFVSYNDLSLSFQFNIQPYKVRLHHGDEYQDYIFDSKELFGIKKYIKCEPDTTAKPWAEELFHQITANEWFEKNIEVILAGQSIIEIKEGFDGSSYFNISPIKVININEDTDSPDNVEEPDDAISIEETDVENFLFPILKNHFEENLPENLNRNDANGFEWYLTNNFFTFDSINDIIEEIQKVMYLLKNDYYSTELDYMRSGFSWILYLDSSIDNKKIPKPEQSHEMVKEYVDEIILFYDRFIKYLQRMMINGEKQGYHLINFIGP